MAKSEIEAKIEYQVVFGEVDASGYRPVRFTRVKYKASDETHVDIRRYQRGYDEGGREVYFPTKVGFQFPERKFRSVVRGYTLVPETYVHPLIVKKSLPLLNSGQLESAVLQAFKTLETRIRLKLNAENHEVGQKLIRRAFDPDKGPLTNYTLPKAEREAFSNYFAGAFGFYRNPCSHRDVDLDPISAFERIVVASTLLKVVEDASQCAPSK